MAAIEGRVVLDRVGRTQVGQALQKGLFRKLRALFSTDKSVQLCLYNPVTHQHVASGVTKADFSRLKAASKRGLGAETVEKAQGILRAAGFTNLDPAVLGTKNLLELARLVGEGKLGSTHFQLY